MEELKEIEFNQPVVPLHVYRALATETQYLRKQNYRLTITQEDLVEQNQAFMDEILRQEQEISQLNTYQSSSKKTSKRSAPFNPDPYLKAKKPPSPKQTVGIEVIILVATVIFSGAAGYGTFYIVRNLVTPLLTH